MNTLDDICSKDESWDIARQLVHKHLSSATLTWRLIRNAWLGSIDEREFIKLFSFTHLSPAFLIRAANLPLENNLSLDSFTQAVQTLGVPLASVFVGINLATVSTLKKSPGPLWKKTCTELMTLVEIGYHLGTRIRELGPAAGCLAGFGVGCGMLVALNEDAKHLREWLTKNQVKPARLNIDGAELSQISGFMVQYLGFGHEAAFGAAFGSGPNSKANLEYSEQFLMWISACRWIEALRYSRNYPRDAKLRSIFPAITPPSIGSGQRNATLESLYAELAPIIKEGSKWCWHLPKSSYEETEQFLNEESKSI